MLIVAGFQDFYWDAVFERVEKNQTQISDLDVCIVVPGADGTRLKKYAEDYGWSYLHIEQDLLAQAQNTAIKLSGSSPFPLIKLQILWNQKTEGNFVNAMFVLALVQYFSPVTIGKNWEGSL